MMKKTPKNFRISPPSDLKIDENNEQEVLTVRRMRAECSLAETISKSAEDNRIIRKISSGIIATLVFIYIGYAVSFFYRYQFKFAPIYPSLPTAPIITFLSSTTATVVGILIIVCRYIFPDNENK